MGGIPGDMGMASGCNGTGSKKREMRHGKWRSDPEIIKTFFHALQSMILIHPTYKLKCQQLLAF